MQGIVWLLDAVSHSSQQAEVVWFRSNSGSAGEEAIAMAWVVTRHERTVCCML